VLMSAFDPKRTWTALAFCWQEVVGVSDGSGN